MEEVLISLDQFSFPLLERLELANRSIVSERSTFTLRERGGERGGGREREREGGREGERERREGGREGGREERL